MNTATISLERLKELELYEKAVEERKGIWVPNYGRVFMPEGGDKEEINKIRVNLEECECELRELRERVKKAEIALREKKETKTPKWWQI